MSADHLAALLFSGDGGVDSGLYHPGRFELRLSGVDQVRHEVVHMHEAHHLTLTDNTAWGAALHLAARTPAWRETLFVPLLDLCRVVQETYATFMSVNVVLARHAVADEALGVYPAYRPLHQALDALLRPVRGPHRRALAAGAVAWCCMQSPVLETLTRVGPEEFTTADLREIDHPDARWRRLAAAPEVVSAALEAADSAVRTAFGDEALRADQPERSPADAIDDGFEPAWLLWESTVYASLGEYLAARGATLLDHHIDLEGAVEPLRRLGADGPVFVPDPDPLDDQVISETVLRNVAYRFTDDLLDSRMMVADRDVDVDEVVRVVDLTSRLGGVPTLSINVRLAHRLAETYRFDPATVADLGTRPAEPVVAVRAVADDGAGGDVLWHVELAEPAHVTRMVEEWGGRGPVHVCLGASCLWAAEWLGRWKQTLDAVGDVVVLLDTSLDAVSGKWSQAGGSIDHKVVSFAGTPLTVVAFAPPTREALWLALGDRVVADMVTGLLAALPGLTLRPPDAVDWREVDPLIRLAGTQIAHTESYVDFTALRGHPWS
ncbi:hypothetical protein [Saccharothrix sp. NRRL B-16314]|uniref:hypothetical protein n=1 Tax=Saccharothrix sp. NRRL B-16314 TaxID=1463825 RepID=UPI000527D37B|nr:hypothetical protein [Saccharothrix sp. NRRL B-16314]